MVCLFTVIFSFKSWQETCLITHLLLVFCTIAQMAKYLSHLACILLNYIYSVTGVRCWQIPVINCETFIVLYSEVHVSMYNWVIALTELIIYLKIIKLDWAFLYQVIDLIKWNLTHAVFNGLRQVKWIVVNTKMYHRIS